MAVEILEDRKLLCADGGDDDADLPELDAFELGTFPTVEAHQPVLIGATTTSGTITAVGATSPLSSIPVLNSLPGAAASLYLDFDGDSEASWGSYSNIVQPAFDQDGDPTTFSDSEVTAIQNIWKYVAEDYAPFKINVTTVQPASFANGVAERVSIGGDGAWSGGSYGGISYIDSFTNSISNESFVFPKNLANGNTKDTAEATSHEAGHAFGLQHQSQYSGTTKVNEYYAGPGDGTAPIMGNSYSATRGLWWDGTSTSSTTIQDDMAVISRSANGFGYRADDHGNTASTATALTVSGGQFSGSGIITTTGDVDYFSFNTSAGSITINVDVLANVNDLDAKLQLFDANGGLLQTSDPSTSFGASMTTTVAAGTYRVAVSSHGGYGDVGQYTISGTIGTSTSTIGAPGNLAAATWSNSQINLTWTDNASNETGYHVDQSLDGVNWTTIVTLGANSTNYSATGLSSGTSYSFRV
ncbi:MAG TPA: fibronectin type III domain-containing protein, partial [Planctomycetaceae bacterium]|nr:fibronectin type III domain-containing protein [Planctomycetaceae bacterium]